MPLPDPAPGLVVHFEYLWHDQFRAGREDGVKARPCVIVVASPRTTGELMVTLVPITHAPPRYPGEAVELPLATKHRLGLDAARSWAVVSEVNRFLWPGVDLRPIPARTPTEFAYGFLPPGLFRQIREALGATVKTGRLKTTPRQDLG